MTKYTCTFQNSWFFGQNILVLSIWVRRRLILDWYSQWKWNSWYKSSIHNHSTPQQTSIWRKQLFILAPPNVLDKVTRYVQCADVQGPFNKKEQPFSLGRWEENYGGKFPLFHWNLYIQIISGCHIQVKVNWQLETKLVSSSKQVSSTELLVLAPWTWPF